MKNLYAAPRFLLADNIIWDGASYHKYKEMKAFLKEINGELSEEDWLVTCIILAPNAPEQNPVEDIWLQGKNELRNKYYLCKSFAEVKKLFVNTIDGKTYNFPKVRSIWINNYYFLTTNIYLMNF